jgi:hypothetical protein
MTSKAATVEEYLAGLPEDRRLAISTVRELVLKNLQPGFEEGMEYGMIGYYVPHSIYPAGYHCDRTKPLSFVSLASQKNYMSLYLTFGLSDTNRRAEFGAAWAAAGKKLDAGVSCIRFKKLDQLALDVIADHIRSFSCAGYIEGYERALEMSKKK